MIIVDTSVIYALLDRADSWHERVVDWYRSALPELATTPLILAEVDHLAHARAGERAQAAWRHDLGNGAYLVEWWGSATAEAVDIADRYADLRLGLADASLVALARRLETNRIATLDERHFRTVRPLTRDAAFTLLPIDA